MSRNRTTFLNECRKFFPGCTADEARDLFWNATAFPFAPIEHCREQLREASRATNRNPNAAMARAERITEEAMREMR